MDDELEPVEMPLLKRLRLVVYFNTLSTIWWARHAAVVHILRYAFCHHCSGYFTREIVITMHDDLGDDVFCEACYAHTFGRGI